MPQADVKHKLEVLIRSAFEEGRCGEHFLVDLEISPSAQVSAFVDGDEGLSLDDCVRISRTLQAILDADPDVAEQYALEVSSPGVSRPLKLLRQYPKHVGRTLRLELADGRKVEGVLASVGPDTLALDIPGQNKKAPAERLEIPFDGVTGALVVVKFGR
jgi:ribosome maturation factor RimP